MRVATHQPPPGTNARQWFAGTSIWRPGTGIPDVEEVYSDYGVSCGFAHFYTAEGKEVEVRSGDWIILDDDPAAQSPSPDVSDSGR